MAAWIGRDDPMEAHARKYARLVGKFRRRFPDRPLRESLSGPALLVLRTLLKEGTPARERLEAIASSETDRDDPVEFCCRLVAFETGITPANESQYLKQAECVQKEMERLGFLKRSDWLLKLRASTAKQPYSGGVLSNIADSPEDEILVVPRLPGMGNWAGLFLFVLIAAIFAIFHRWKTAMILCGIGVLSLLTPVEYWVFDKPAGRLRRKLRTGLFPMNEITGYLLSDITGIKLDVNTDNEGGRTYKVRVIMQQGQEITVSEHKRDADRISAFLGLDEAE